MRNKNSITSLKMKVRRNMIRSGYVLHSDGQFMHRFVYEQAHGKIQKHWNVHHIDCSRDNNNIENLIALPPKFHKKIHEIMKQENRVMGRDRIVSLLASYVDKLPLLLKKKKEIEIKLDHINKEIEQELNSRE